MLDGAIEFSGAGAMSRKQSPFGPRRLALAAFAALLIALPALAAPSLAEQLIDGARRQVGVTLGYDSDYARIAYPGGDVALLRCVCTIDLIIAYRKIGVDMQVLVHE